MQSALSKGFIVDRNSCPSAVGMNHNNMTAFGFSDGKLSFLKKFYHFLGADDWQFGHILGGELEIGRNRDRSSCQNRMLRFKGKALFVFG